MVCWGAGRGRWRAFHPQQFFVDVALSMRAFVRPVSEPVFNVMDEVDGMYVIETGIVVIKSKLYRKNCAFGFDTLYRAYNGQTWGYMALPLSHVALHMLPAADLQVGGQQPSGGESIPRTELRKQNVSRAMGVGCASWGPPCGAAPKGSSVESRFVRTVTDGGGECGACFCCSCPLACVMPHDPAGHPCQAREREHQSPRAPACG